MSDKKNWLKIAEDYIRANKIEKAIKVYLEAYDETRDLHALSLVGDLYLKLGDVKAAMESFLEAANCYAAENRAEQAISSYLKAHSANPDDLDIMIRLSELYFRSKSRPQGIRFLQRATKYALDKKTLTAEERYKVNAIVKLNQKLLGANPNDAELLANQAALYSKTGKTDQANTLFMQAGSQLIEEGKFEKGLELLGPLLNENNCDIRLLELATDIFNKLSRSGEALLLQKRALKADPQNNRLLKLQANTLLAMGNHKEAEEVFRNLVKLDPSAQPEFLKLCSSLVSHHEIDRAIAGIKELIPGSKYSQKTEMVYLLKKILEEDPSHTEALNTLATLYSECGDSLRVLKTYHTQFDVYCKKGLFEKASWTAKHLLDLNYKDESFLRSYEKLILQNTGGGEFNGDPQENAAPVARRVEEPPKEEKPEVEFVSKPSSKKQSPEDAGQDLLSNIDILCRYGHFESAVSTLKSNLENDPENTVLHEKLKSVFIQSRLLTHAARQCIELFRLYQRNGAQEKADAVLKEALKLDPTLSPEMVHAGRKHKEVGVGFAGNFETFTIPDVIQFIENSGKSGILKIVSPDEEGTLYISGGQVVDAEIGQKNGIDAVFHLIKINKGTYEFVPKETKFPVRIRLSTMNLLLEGLRLLDEERARKSGG